MYVIQPSFMLRLFYDKYRYYKSTFYDKYRYYKSTAAINISIFRAISVYMAPKSENIEMENQTVVNFFSYSWNIYRGNKHVDFKNKI